MNDNKKLNIEKDIQDKEKKKKIIFSKEMNELLQDRPAVDKRLYVGYFLFIIIALIFLYFSIVIFIHGLKFELYGDEVIATVKAINEDERLISIEYVYDDIKYNNILKYWDENLDINSDVKILVLKDDPNEISSTANYLLLSGFLFALSIGLLSYGLIAFFKSKREETRIFLLIKYGTKKIGKILAVEDKYVSSEFRHKYIISAMCDDVIYDSKKLNLNYNPEGMSDYLVDIYIDEEKNENYYLDYSSIRSKIDEERKKMNQNE